MGLIVANGIRRRKIKAAIEAWDKVRNPNSKDAKASMDRISEKAREAHGDHWLAKEEDPEILSQIKLWYFWRKVYTGALMNEGKGVYHLT